MENYQHSTISTAKKEQHEHAKNSIKKGKNLSSSKSEAVIETISNNDTKNTKILSDGHKNIAPMSSQESTAQSQNSAHFDLPPDTEDL